MAKLAIKGHKTRGNEIIEILEMLGGKNDRNYCGSLSNYEYTINEHGIIDWSFFQYDTFTLEEFLEKFPYKVGDKVQYKGATSCGSVFEVEKMHWEDEKVKYTVRFLGHDGYGGKYTVTDEYLQPFKGETMAMEEKETFKEDEGTLSAIDLTMEFKKADEIEVILGDYEFVLKNGKTYFVKRYKYPKTYEECCKTLKIPVNGDIVYAGNWACYVGEEYLDKHLNTTRKFQQLLICRDAYWKMAGEQMGLDEPWKPNWKNGLSEFCVAICEDKILRGNYGSANFILTFPTEEMRDAFYENFNDLIEECNELL